VEHRQITFGKWISAICQTQLPEVISALDTFLHVGESRRQLATLDGSHASTMQPEPEPEPANQLGHSCATDAQQSSPGMLTAQGGQGGRPAPLASRLHRIPTHFPLNLHGI
jgi:hypothetical protein